MDSRPGTHTVNCCRRSLAQRVNVDQEYADGGGGGGGGEPWTWWQTFKNTEYNNTQNNKSNLIRSAAQNRGRGR